jgi:hypothetical protein
VGDRPVNLTRSWRLAVGLALLGGMGNGCSLLYTKGPPAPCTTSNDSPVADTVLAAASVGAVVAGSIIAHNTSNCGGAWCGLNNGFTGGGILVLGGIGTLVFVPSAITGYERTADCRGWLERNPEPAPHPHPPARQPERSSSVLETAPACPSRGDAPVICARGPLHE